jgi:Na+-transporting NADH:ubiquinone oxidoreductase subunit NqrB
MSIKILFSSILVVKKTFMKILSALNADPRHFQILTLSSLLLFLTLWSDFSPELHVMAMIVVAALGTQYLCFKFFKIPSTDYRSPLITSLSLALLFKTNLIWLYPLIAVVAIGSKFFIRINNKHIFNPANGAIVLGFLALR